MAKMKAIEAAVLVLEKEGVTVAFGVPGAAINPMYAAMKSHGGIGHILRQRQCSQAVAGDQRGGRCLADQIGGACFILNDIRIG